MSTHQRLQNKELHGTYDGLTGDLLEAFRELNIDVIAHCCNCQGVMGSGIALQIKEQFPEAFAAYSNAMKLMHGERWSLGTISMAQIPSASGKIVVNLHAQYHYGTGERHLDYEALYVSLEKTRNMMLDSGLTTIGVPMLMGCDRAGGAWPIVEAMLKEVFNPYGIDVLYVEWSGR
jgi:O-acetyl-ADP-ribose deacetylase (regulator of RNase III)